MTNPNPKYQAGKGSHPRPVNKKMYDQNFDEINWLKAGDKYIFTDDINVKHTVISTGIRREVKGVLMDFFTIEDGTIEFFYPSEIKPPKFVKI